MITIEVNGKTIEAKKDEMLLTALRRAGIEIPTLCHIDGMTPTGACRLCVVEVDGMPGLVPSCAFPVRDAMKVKTHSQRVMTARKAIVELLLANHPDDCLFCIRNNNCELQKLAAVFGIHERNYKGGKSRYKIDSSSPSIVRDPAKCILCGRCVRVCEEVQGVSCIDFSGRGCSAIVCTAFDQGLNVSSCVNCGQCVMVCPTGALREQSAVADVINALRNPELHVVVQHAPAVSVSLAEEFGMKPGSDICGIMTSLLRKIGFAKVFETSFSADLTIMEEASELVHRIKTGGKLPMMTSCSPGWIKFVEQFYPDFIGNLSTCKSPMEMLGPIIKTYYAQVNNIDPSKIYSVAVMPCTAKKFEAERPEMGRDGYQDVDAVLTTRELAEMVRIFGIDVSSIEPSFGDNPFGERSTAGKLFGASGGVMEAAIRTAYFLITGNELEDLDVKDVRGLKGVKEAKLNINGLEVGVAVVSGLSNARDLLEQIKSGRKDLHFIEVMTCPGGCIAGGGQPRSKDPEAVAARLKKLYKIDKTESLRVSHKNEALQKLYKDFLGAPLGEKSHHLLHTHFSAREVVK